ncbi:MAG TPA: sigma-70 family RNA polymerase sigma factor [Gammaproteobacteria bacterium]|nr:sigma-70 family RNA polymerase sigma factor [Gammaproteobacteria bacterium]
MADGGDAGRATAVPAHADTAARSDGRDSDAPAAEGGRRARQAELLAATGRGDQQAFAALYGEASPNLFGIALRILRQEGAAQECLQDAWVRIWEHAADYRPERGAPLTWMGVIVRRRALDMLRRSGRERVGDDPEAVDRELDQWTWTEGVEVGSDPHQREALQRCLERLRQEQREALRLAYFDGLSHPELARRLAVPLGTAKTWIRRAMEKLRLCLEA